MLGLRRKEILQRYDDILAFSELGEAIDNPVKNYSSGMYMRLAFAIAVQVDPDVLLVDEVLAVGDEAFQRKCYARMAEFRQGRRTVVLVSHDLDAIRRFCDRALWLDHGRLAADGDPRTVTDQYLRTASRRIAERASTPAGPPLHGLPGIGPLSGQVRLGPVRLLDEEGNERNLFREGDEVTVEVDYQATISSRTA